MRPVAMFRVMMPDMAIIKTKMETIIVILRGINVGGKNKIPMAELKTLFEKAGFKNVTTYIQSGNVVCASKESGSKELETQIQQMILKKFKCTVPVIVRSVDEIQTVVNSNPFVKMKGIDLEKLHVTFLADVPAKEHLEKIKQYNYPPDEFKINGREAYLHCPVNYGNSKLSNTFFESKLKVVATTRNWRTVNELLRMGKAL